MRVPSDQIPLAGGPPVIIPVKRDDGWKGYIHLIPDGDRGRAMVVGDNRVKFTLFIWDRAKIIWPDDPEDENNLRRLAFLDALTLRDGWSDDPLEMAS